MLEFAWGTDMDQASLEVRDKIEVLRLPLEAKPPVLLRFNPSTEPIMRLALIAAEASQAGSEQAELMRLRRYADDDLKKRLEPVDGVAAVKVGGGLEDEIQVADRPAERLAQLNLSVEHRRSIACSRKTSTSPAAASRKAAQRYLVRTVNQFADDRTAVPRQMRREAMRGRPARCRMAACRCAGCKRRAPRVHEQGYKEREAIIRLDGREAVELAIYKEGDANTVAVADAVRKARARSG